METHRITSLIVVDANDTLVGALKCMTCCALGVV